MKCRAFAVLGVLAVASTAAADDESDRIAVDRLSALVHSYAQDDARLRPAVIAGFLVAGAVTLGVGVPVLANGLSRPQPRTSDDTIVLVSGIALTSLGGAAILASPFALIHTRLENIDERVAALRGTPTQRLANAERILSLTAADEHSARITSAVFGFVAGAVNVAFVPVDLAVGNSGLIILNGAAAFIAIVTASVRLVAPTAIERLWQTWRVGTGRALSHSPILVPNASGLALTF